MFSRREVLESVLRSRARLAGDQIVTACPQCGKAEHLYLHRTRLLYLCFRCGLKGSLLAEVSRSEWRQYLRGLGEPREGTSVASVDLGGHLYPLASGIAPAGSPTLRARKYLAGRGVTEGQVSRYLLSVKPFDGRVWFPYWENRRLTWAMGRALGSQEPKTVDFGEEKPLYGVHVTKPVGDVFVVEGVFDHLATPSSVAVCGSTVSRSQLFALSSLSPERVFVLFDPDAEDKAVQAAAEMRSVGLKAFPVLWRGNEKDPADLGGALMGELVNKVRSSAPVRPQAVRLHVGPRARPGSCSLPATGPREPA